MNDMALRSINGLSLCSGIAGIELGLKLVLGDTYHTIAYVEREAYAAACLVARMEEGYLDEAPVWDDLTSFDGSTWRGTVDIVTAGFPCQPYSVAGKQLKEKDPRHLWPEIARIIKECQPQCVFLENVNIRAFKEPFRDLQTLGFTLSDPYAITAAELGAGHIRRRIFVLAVAKGQQVGCGRLSRQSTKGISSYPNPGLRDQSRRSSRQSGEDTVFDKALAGHCDDQGRVQSQGSEREKRRRAGNAIEVYSDSEKQDWWASKNQEREATRNNERSTWWSREPGLERLVHGIPNRVDRDRALGNAVVPAMAAKAFIALTMKGGLS